MLDATLILLRQATYLWQSTHPRFGLEPIAIILSLPWALLMWAYVISHFAEICWSSFAHVPLFSDPGRQDGDVFHCAAAL